MAIKCYYHNDLDGHASGAVVARRYPGEVEFHEINYGQDDILDDINPSDVVIMVDFSLQPLHRMIELQARCFNLIWIDHHKSVDEELQELQDGGSFLYSGTVDSRSQLAACELCWKYFFPTKPVPEYIRLLGAYDTWRYKDTDEEEYVLNFQYGMRAEDTHPKSVIWTSLQLEIMAEEFLQSLCLCGKAIRKYTSKMDAEHTASAAFPLQWMGLHFLALNSSTLGSLQFQSMWDQSKYDAMMCFKWAGNHWTISMYTDKPGVDVSNIAKYMNGGGHKQAAGFQVHKKDLFTELRIAECEAGIL